MKAIQANLAQLYQQSYLLIHYLIFGFLLFPLVIFWNKHPFEISIVLSAAIYGVAALITTRYIESLTKPMVFCLPGHTQIVRNILFRMGFIVSIISAAIFAFRNTNNYAILPYSLLVYTSLYILFWTTGIWVASKVRLSSNFGLFIVLGFGIGYLNCYEAIQQFLFSPYSIVIILITWVFGRYLWKHLGRPDIARIYCNQPKISLFYLCEDKAARNIQKERVTKINVDQEKSVAAVERFFIPKIANSASHPFIPFLWGSIYRSFGQQIILQLKGGWIISIILFPLFILLGYIYDKNSFGMDYMTTMFIFCQHFDLNIFNPSLIKQGRIQRLGAAITVLTTGIIISTCLITILYFLMQIISPYMPEINLMGKSTFNSSGYLSLYLIPILLPAGASLDILFQRRLGLKCIGFLALIIPATLTTILLQRSNINLSLVEVVILLLLLSWGLFIGVLYWTCFHRTLSVQKSKGI